MLGLKRSSALADDTILTAENLYRIYRAGQEVVRALDGVSLRLNKREVVSVYGPSGSGKTTLLSILGGLDRPTSGRVFLEGVEISSLDEKQLSAIRRRRVGFVFQNYNLVNELTVLENVELPLLFDGRPRRETEELSFKLLERMNLLHKTNRRPYELSAGEQQRVATARALVNGPPVVLMDEPTGNLDLESSSAVMELVNELNQERGTTFVIATHSHEIAQKCSSRVLLKAGRICPGT